MDGQLAGTRARVSFARVAFSVHSWLGLSFFVLITTVLLSGTLAVFRDEIDWLIFPQIRVAPGPDRVGLDRLIATVRETYPEMGLLGQFPAEADGPHTAIGVIGVSPKEGVRRVWVDPYRGVAQGTTPFVTPGYLLGQFHAYLMIPTWGYAIVCSLVFFLLASLITGLLTYRKFWRGFFRRPRSRTLRTLMGDLHRLGGIWSIWFLVILIATSLWYFWIRVGEPLLHFPHAVQDETPPVMPGADFDRLGPATPKMFLPDRLAAEVRHAFPDFRISYLRLPDTHGDAVTFGGNTGELFGQHLSKVYVEPYSGRILGHRLSRDTYSFAWLGAMADALHFGNFAGLVSKTIWFLFGAVVTALSITGVIVFWKRTARNARPSERSAARRIWYIVRPWGGAMGVLKPVNLGGVVFSLVALTMTIRFYSMPLDERAARYAAQPMGPFSMGAVIVAGLGDTSDPVRPGARAMVLAQYCHDCWKDIRRLWVNIGPRSMGSDGIRIVGQPGYARAWVKFPETIDADTRLWMVAERWNGNLDQTSWALEGR